MLTLTTAARLLDVRRVFALCGIQTQRRGVGGHVGLRAVVQVTVMTRSDSWGRGASLFGQGPLSPRLTQRGTAGFVCGVASGVTDLQWLRGQESRLCVPLQI